MNHPTYWQISHDTLIFEHPEIWCQTVIPAPKAEFEESDLQTIMPWYRSSSGITLLELAKVLNDRLQAKAERIASRRGRLLP